jgi:hypothetical protein
MARRHGAERPSAVQKPKHQLLLAGYGRQQLVHLAPAHHHRQLRRRARSADLLQPRQIHFEYLFVEKDQGSQGLPMGRGGNPAAIGQPVQKTSGAPLSRGWRSPWKRINQRTQ